MSNVSKRPRDESRRVPRRTDEMARDLEFLAQRLAESREAIVNLLATEAGPGDARPEEPPPGPRLLRNSSEGAELVRQSQDLPDAVVTAPDSQALPAEQGNGGVSSAEPGRRTSAASRRLLAVVLLAIGAVIVLTTLVSLL